MSGSDDMPIIFPAQNTLCEVFGSSSPFSRLKPKAPIREHPLKNPIFSAWSAVDTAKDKAGELSNEAVREFEKASTKAQQKAGKIELYSPKYFAACTIGGILACVGFIVAAAEPFFSRLTGHNTYSCYPARSCQMQTPGRSEPVQGQLRGLGKDWSS